MTPLNAAEGRSLGQLVQERPDYRSGGFHDLLIMGTHQRLHILDRRFRLSDLNLWCPAIGQSFPPDAGENQPALGKNIHQQEKMAVNQPNEPSKVIVVDLQMPFFSIVVLMVKWALASIPAIVILAAIFSLVTGLMGGMMSTMMRWPPATM